MKSLIVGHLGHGELILPGLIAKGLTANGQREIATERPSVELEEVQR